MKQISTKWWGKVTTASDLQKKSKFNVNSYFTLLKPESKCEGRQHRETPELSVFLSTKGPAVLAAHCSALRGRRCVCRAEDLLRAHHHRDLLGLNNPQAGQPRSCWAVQEKAPGSDPRPAWALWGPGLTGSPGPGRGMRGSGQAPALPAHLGGSPGAPSGLWRCRWAPAAPRSAGAPAGPGTPPAPARSAPSPPWPPRPAVRCSAGRRLEREAGTEVPHEERAGGSTAGGARAGYYGLWITHTESLELGVPFPARSCAELWGDAAPWKGMWVLIHGQRVGPAGPWSQGWHQLLRAVVRNACPQNLVNLQQNTEGHREHIPFPAF